MTHLYWLTLPLLVTGCLVSATPTDKLCAVTNPTDVEIENVIPGFTTVDVQNPAVAQAFYDGMTDITEQLLTEKEVPKGTIMYRRTGRSFICFKGILPECVYYSCNFPFKNLKTGELRP